VLVIDNVDICLCDVILGRGIYIANFLKLFLFGTIYGGRGLTNFITLRSLLQNVGAVH